MPAGSQTAKRRMMNSKRSKSTRVMHDRSQHHIDKYLNIIRGEQGANYTDYHLVKLKKSQGTHIIVKKGADEMTVRLAAGVKIPRTVSHALFERTTYGLINGGDLVAIFPNTSSAKEEIKEIKKQKGYSRSRSRSHNSAFTFSSSNHSNSNN